MQLIIDRTEADVLLRNEKGYYKSSDLNRVEAFTEALLPLLPQMDIHLTLETKTDWALTDAFSQDSWPVKRQMQRYLGNVRALCDAVGLQPALPESMERLTHIGANQIEQALLDVHGRIEGVLSTYRFSGEVFAGEE